MFTLNLLQLIAQVLPNEVTQLTEDELNLIELALAANSNELTNFRGTIKFPSDVTEETAKAEAKTYFRSIVTFAKTGAAYIRPRKNGFSLAFEVGSLRQVDENLEAAE